MASPLDLLIDRKTDEASSQNLWFNIHDAVIAVMAYRGAPADVLIAYGAVAYSGGLLANRFSRGKTVVDLTKIVSLIGSSWCWLTGNLRAAAIVGGIALALGFTSGWHLHGVFDDAAASKAWDARVNDHLDRLKESNGIAASYEEIQAMARIENQKINQQNEKALADKTPGVHCQLPVKRVRVIAAAIAGHAAP